MGDVKSLISKIEKSFEQRIENRNKKIFETVKETFDSIPSFQKTERDGKEILLDTFIERKESDSKDEVIVSIKTNKNPERIFKLLEQDERGVGSLGIEPKGSKYKLISRSKAEISIRLKGTPKV